MTGIQIWNEFLNNLKSEITNVSFDTWFNEDDTKFYSLENNILTITVNQEFIKKHIEEHYIDIMNDAIMKVTNENITFNIVLENEVNKIEEKKFNDVVDTFFEKQSSINANLNPNYVFENFVVGKSNKFAYKAARVIAEAPGSYNPLFLYGESGVGKTHLMHAIGNYLLENSDKKVLYITSDKFVDEYTRIFRYNDRNSFDKIDAFKDKYRNVDVLIILTLKS